MVYNERELTLTIHSVFRYGWCTLGAELDGIFISEQCPECGGHGAFFDEYGDAVCATCNGLGRVRS